MAIYTSMYKAAVKILVEHGDLKAFIDIFRVAPISKVATGIGISTKELKTKIESDLSAISSEEISGMASFFNVSSRKLKKIILQEIKKRKEDIQFFHGV